MGVKRELGEVHGAVDGDAGVHLVVEPEVGVSGQGHVGLLVLHAGKGTQGNQRMPPKLPSWLNTISSMPIL